MVRDIRRRIAALEVQHHAGSPKFELWVNEGDGILRTKDGKAMTRDAFDAAFPNARKIGLDIFENSKPMAGRITAASRMATR